jgi:hypothetical protein
MSAKEVYEHIYLIIGREVRVGKKEEVKDKSERFFYCPLEEKYSLHDD